MDGPLYHFSEDGSIRRFRPRPVPLARRQRRALAAEPLVWAIDADHVPLYLFPRDCPRIVVWTLPTTTPADRRRWLGDTRAPFVAFIERDWLPRVRATTLYRYQLPPQTFESLHDAGMAVSRSPVDPLNVVPIDDLPAALHDAQVDLRPLPSLLPLQGIWDSTLHASGIRLAHARDWPASP